MILINSFEIIGTIAFAISGALVGVEKKLDLFGVIFLSITTAVGGGIFRDIIIGSTPPVVFIKPGYCIISIVTALLTFYFYEQIIKLKNVVLISDAIGLGVFTAVGAKAALNHNLNQVFIVISMGLITGIGGGILRDVFTKNIPLVFRKEIYAMASIAGALGLYFAQNLSDSLSTYICFSITFVVRIFAVLLNLHLPSPKTKIAADS